MAGAAPASCAVAGAAALLAVTQRAPLTATALAFEFTHVDWTLLPPSSRPWASPSARPDWSTVEATGITVLRHRAPDQDLSGSDAPRLTAGLTLTRPTIAATIAA